LLFSFLTSQILKNCCKKLLRFISQWDMVTEHLKTGMWRRAKRPVASLIKYFLKRSRDQRMNSLGTSWNLGDQT
jgi:hypothetical protein